MVFYLAGGRAPLFGGTGSARVVAVSSLVYWWSSTRRARPSPLICDLVVCYSFIRQHEAGLFVRETAVACSRGRQGFRRRHDLIDVARSLVLAARHKLVPAEQPIVLMITCFPSCVLLSVMDTAFSRGRSSRTATGGALSIDHARETDQEAQERAVLGTAETVFDRFCEQVCGSVLLATLVHEGSVRVGTRGPFCFFSGSCFSGPSASVIMFSWSIFVFSVLLYRPFCLSSTVVVELVVDG